MMGQGKYDYIAQAIVEEVPDVELVVVFIFSRTPGKSGCSAKIAADLAPDKLVRVCETMHQVANNIPIDAAAQQN